MFLTAGLSFIIPRNTVHKIVGTFLLFIFILCEFFWITRIVPDKKDLRTYVAQKAVITEFTPENFDQQVLKLCTYVNDLLFDPYDRRMAVVSELRCSLPYFFKMYVGQPDGPYGAFCQKSALSLSEVLWAFGIRTRQWHVVVNGIGVHQFLGYYNPFSQRWIALDPFYGVEFQDSHGRLLSAREAWKLRRQTPLDRLLRPVAVPRASSAFQSYDDYFQGRLEPGLYYANEVTRLKYLCYRTLVRFNSTLDHFQGIAYRGYVS